MPTAPSSAKSTKSSKALRTQKKPSKMTVSFDEKKSVDHQEVVREGRTKACCLSDPRGHLPADSEPLIGNENVIATTLVELERLIDKEKEEVEKSHQQIDLWQKRIEKNNALIKQNAACLMKNSGEIPEVIRWRDHWRRREREVLKDYREAKGSENDNAWAWLIKKYELREPRSFLGKSNDPSLSELCDIGISCLATEYKIAAERCDQEYQRKEAENTFYHRETAELQKMNQRLYQYINGLYAMELEFLNDGVLLFKEFALKLKVFEAQASQVTYTDLRSWAESYLDAFLRKNPHIHQRVVSEFRKMASIPLPI